MKIFLLFLPFLLQLFVNLGQTYEIGIFFLKNLLLTVQELWAVRHMREEFFGKVFEALFVWMDCVSTDTSSFEFWAMKEMISVDHMVRWDTV